MFSFIQEPIYNKLKSNQSEDRKAFYNFSAFEGWSV